MKKKYKETEKKLELARELAREAIVLMENREHLLPLKRGSRIAVFGKCQYDTIIGGAGSGRSFSKMQLRITEELENAGFILSPELKNFYEAAFYDKNPELKNVNREEAEDGEIDLSSIENLVASGAIYEIFEKYDAPSEEMIPDLELVEKVAEDTKLAMYIIGRSSGGEECDRRINNDYYLTESEKQMIHIITSHFPNVIVVYNVNGAMDTGWETEYSQIKAVLFMGAAGEQGAGALADIISGKITPSGKLAQSLAFKYEDYPSSKHFSCNRDDMANVRTYEDYGLIPDNTGNRTFSVRPVTCYQEDIYVGYRYFDSFQVPVHYSFGHGLSYADFELDCVEVALSGAEICLIVQVTNVSENYKGKEILQLYVGAPGRHIEQPYKQLKVFEKTSLLNPGQKELITIRVPLYELASFDVSSRAYVIEEGCYTLQLGNSSANTRIVAIIKVENNLITDRVKGTIGISAANEGRVEFLSKKGEDEQIEETISDGIPQLLLTTDYFSANVAGKGYNIKPLRYDFDIPAQKSTLEDVKVGKVPIEAFINQMSPKELAVLCNGYGSGLPFFGLGQDNVKFTISDDDGNEIGVGTHPNAMPGYQNPGILKYGICSASYKDGPASVGKIAWPTGMVLANMFNKELLYEFGCACGEEAEELLIDSWLGPGMNIIRNPIEGRAFEYFSEDPFVAGCCGMWIVRGAMENNEITCCPKHFALNEQETFRRGKEKRNIDAVDSIASERAIREIYLKPFEMVIRDGYVRTVMTSFNKINGIFAAGNHSLLRSILRDEWGYQGVVVTDWGDMDIVVDGADAIAAGNDVVMPGGPPVIAQVLKGYEEGRVTITQMREAAAHLMNFIMHSKSYRKWMEEGQ